MRYLELESAVANFLRNNLGLPHVLNIEFDSDFVSGNTISGTVQETTIDRNGNEVAGDVIDLESVAFTTDHATTMTLLAQSIQAVTSVLSAQKDGGDTLVVTGANNGATLTVSITVTGGASQAEASYSDAQSPETVTVLLANSMEIDGDSANFVKPAYPYATFRINSIQPLSTSGLQEFDEETNLPLHTQELESTISVNYFGSNAVYELQKVFRRLHSVTTSDYFSARGFAVRGRGNLRDLTALLETHFEPRANFDFQIGFRDQWFEDYSTIETVGITGTIVNEAEDETVFLNATLGE